MVEDDVIYGLGIQEAGTWSETASETRTPDQRTRNGNENEVSDSHGPGTSCAFGHCHNNVYTGGTLQMKSWGPERLGDTAGGRVQIERQVGSSPPPFTAIGLTQSRKTYIMRLSISSGGGITGEPFHLMQSSLFPYFLFYNQNVSKVARGKKLRLAY